MLLGGSLSLTLQLRAPEVLDHILPVGGVLEPAQIGLKFSAQNLERSALANTVGSDKTQDISRPRHGQSVELEAVGGVSVCNLGLEVGREVDDGNCAKGALLRADTATNTKALGEEGNLRIGGHFNAELATAHDRARLFAFLSTFLRCVSISHTPLGRRYL